MILNIIFMIILNYLPTLISTNLLAPSLKLSAIALRRLLSRSITPQVACNNESRRQSPAVLFHSGYNRLDNCCTNSSLQFITSFSLRSILVRESHHNNMQLYNNVSLLSTSLSRISSNNFLCVPGVNRSTSIKQPPQINSHNNLQ